MVFKNAARTLPLCDLTPFQSDFKTNSNDSIPKGAAAFASPDKARAQIVLTF